MLFLARNITLLFFLLLVLPIASAASFNVDAVPVNNKIAIEEFAKYRLDIKNNLEHKEEYRIYTADFPTWDVRTEPIANPITLELGPQEEGSVEIIIDPLKINDIGTYAVNVNVRSKISNQLIPVPLKVTILSTDFLIGGYVPTIVTKVDIPEKIDPRYEVPIMVILNNQNIIDYPDLIVKLESELIKDTVITKLSPKEEKTLNLKATLEPFTKPQEDNLVVAVFKGNRSIINPIVRRIEIAGYKDFSLVNEEKKFLLARSHYAFQSNNNEYEGIVRIKTSSFGSIFSSTSPKAKIAKEDGEKYFVWDVKLEDNRMDVYVTKNYIPLFVMITALIALVILYYVLRSPLLIKKEAGNVVKSEGGIKELTLILHIRNRSQKQIRDIEINDTVPGLVAVEREVSIGSLQPTKILRHNKKGALVKWSVDALDASEERVLSYKIKSRLSILGSFRLPAATAIFRYSNKTHTTSSNILTLNN